MSPTPTNWDLRLDEDDDDDDDGLEEGTSKLQHKQHQGHP